MLYMELMLYMYYPFYDLKYEHNKVTSHDIK
jgi:hypothetical protein